MNKVTVILILNSIYNVYVNDIIFGSYNSSAIALIECNKLTGLSYTDIQEYLVTDSVGNEYTQKEIFDLQRGVQANYIIIEGTISQSGINIPVFQINLNTHPLTYSLVLSYSDVGQYLITLNQPVLSDLTEIYMTPIIGAVNAFVNDTQEIIIHTKTLSDAYSNGLLLNTSLLIKIPT